MIHSFDGEIAKSYGVDEAILFQHIAHWVYVNEANNRNFYNGRYWTYNSGKAYEKIFPFWKDQAIRKKLRKLVDLGLIIKSNFGMNVYDHTNWYTLTDFGKAISRNWTVERDKYDSRLLQNEQSYNTTTNSLGNSSTNINTINNIANNSIKDTIRPTGTVEHIIAEWNTLEKLGIVPVMKLTNGTKRKESLMARLKTYTEDDFMKAIENIRHSSFLQGSGNKGWVITFDWFVKPNNFPKVLEGNYNDTKPEPPKYESKPEEVHKQTPEEIAAAKAWWDSLEDDDDV